MSDRRYDSKKRRLLQDPQSTNDKSTKVELDVKRRKRADYWNEIRISKENESFFADHFAALKYECSRPPNAQGAGKIKQMMVSTYEQRQAEISTTGNTLPVNKIVAKYPPLGTVIGVSIHLAHVLKI